MILTTSSHFDRSVAAIGLLSVILAGSFLWLKHRIDGSPLGRLIAKHESTARQSVLQKNDSEAVSYNSSTHKLIIATPSGTKTEYSRDPVIHLQKNGGVKIDRNLFGLESNPYIGVGTGNSGPRVQLGVSWFKAQRFDLNSSLGFSVNHSPSFIEPNTSLSFNFWRDTNLFFGIDPFSVIAGPKQVHYQAGIFLRF